MERLTSSEIITSVLTQFTPVWIGLAVILTLSWLFRSKLGLMNGLAIVALAIIFDRVSQSFGDRMQRHRQGANHD